MDLFWKILGVAILLVVPIAWGLISERVFHHIGRRRAGRTKS